MSDNCNECGKPTCIVPMSQHVHIAKETPLCHGHAEPQPTAPMSVDLTKLIAYCADFANRNSSSPICPTQAERDEIVLALRVLRLVRKVTGGPDVDALEQFERILGIGGGE